MKNLVALGAVLLVVFVVVAIVYGWIEYRRSDDTTTIDIYTQEMKRDVKHAAEKAADAGKRLIDKTGDSLESAEENRESKVEGHLRPPPENDLPEPRRASPNDESAATNPTGV